MATDPAEEILRSRGPCLSSDLAKALIDDYGLTPDAARKRVSRLGPNVRRLAYRTFPRNARFVYLQENYGSPWFWDALTKALLENSPAYCCALAALIQRDGLMPKPHFLIACGAPIAQTRHLPPEVILERFKKAKVVEEIDVPGIGPCVARAQRPEHYDFAIHDMRARLVAEAILLKAIRMWARNLGLGSYDKIVLRDEGQPKVGTFLWDLTAPSYIAPMLEWAGGKPKPGFIACDVLLGSEVTKQGLRPFIQKCKTLRTLKRVGRCLQIFVADKYDGPAFRAAKEAGIVPATTESLFGEEVAEGLRHLMGVLAEAAAVAVRPEMFDELFQRLGRIEGAANNLRGALFEFLVGELVRQQYGGRVTLNRIFRNEAGATAEVDVIGEQASLAVHFIECKGHHPAATVDDREVERWLTTRIPLVRGEALKHPDWKNRKLCFEFWTVGKLSDDAIAMIKREKAAVRPGKYTLDYRDAAGVAAVAAEVNDRALAEALEKHFLEHPLATAERDSARRARRADERRRMREAIDLDALLGE